MRSNYDGTEYEAVTLGNGGAVHYGNAGSTIAACGRRSQRRFYATDDAVTCKTCLKMEQTTHTGTEPLIKDTIPAAAEAPAPAAKPEQTIAQKKVLAVLRKFPASARTVAQVVSGGPRPRRETTKIAKGVLESLVQHGWATKETVNGVVIYRVVREASVEEALAEVKAAYEERRASFAAFCATDHHNPAARAKAKAREVAAIERVDEATTAAYAAGAAWYRIDRAREGR